MKISDTDLDVRDRTWAEQTLGLDEELLMALKPKVRLNVRQLFFGIVFMAVAMAPLAGAIGGGEPFSVAAIAIPAAFFFVGGWVAASALLEPRAMRRGLYLVTTRRLLRLTVSAWRGKKREESYAIRPGAMIRVENVKPDGSGDLYIEYESEAENLEHGGLIERMPQAQRVAETLRAQLPSAPSGENADAAKAAQREPQKQPGTKTGFAILGFLALVFGGIGAYTAWNTADLYFNGEAAEGTVVGYEHDSGSKGKTVTHAVIRYTAKDGRTFRERNPVGGNMVTFDLGEKVSVKYDPAAPTRIQVLAVSTFLPPAIFLFVGLGLVAAFFVLLFCVIRDRLRQG